MTQSTFDRFYLRRGTPLPPDGKLAEPEDSGALRTALWRGRMKNRFG
jgi:hypothetical protein